MANAWSVAVITYLSLTELNDWMYYIIKRNSFNSLENV